MKIETLILVFVPTISILSLLTIPRNKFFQAQFIALFVQLPTWILGLLAVELDLIQYPYRELDPVNRTSFLFEYVVLPIMCIHFNIHFPENSSKFVKAMYYCCITLAFTIIEYFAEKYTLILKYTGWHIHWTFLSICFIFWLSRVTTLWFYSKR